MDSDFKNLEKKTQSLVNQYNKTVDSIKSQELAIQKVKDKINEFNTGANTPKSIKMIETSLAKSKEEAEKLKETYNSLLDKKSRNKEDIDRAKYVGNDKLINQRLSEKTTLESGIQKVKQELDFANNKVISLQKNFNAVKNNPLNTDEVKELNSLLELLNSKLSESKNKANSLKNEINEAFKRKNTDDLSSGMKDIIGRIDKFKNKMSRLIGTAMIFSLIRSQLTGLRNGFLTLLKSNDDFKSSLNQIKANLMTAFAPIYNAALPAINSLMAALSRLTGTLAMFISGVFGKSISDAKNEAKGLSKALDKTAKSGKKASGSLASFDNLEVLQDKSGGSESGGINYDGEIQYNQKLLDFLNKVRDFVKTNKDSILGFISGITAALIALNTFGLKPIKALGIGVLVAGIVYAVENLIKYLNDPSLKNLGGFIEGIGIAVIGLGIAFLGLPAIITGVVVLILGLLIKNWNNIKDFLGGIVKWLFDKAKDVGGIPGMIIESVADMIDNLIKDIDLFISGIKDILDGLIKFISSLFKGNLKGAIDGLIQMILGLFKMLLSGLGAAWHSFWGLFKTVILSIGEVIAELVNGIGNIINDAINVLLKVIEMAVNGIINLFLSIPNFIIGVIQKILGLFGSFGQQAGDVIGAAFKGAVNGALSVIEGVLNTPINAINKLIGVINKVPGINLGKLNTFKLPRLAKGAVIPPRQEFAAILGDQKHGTNIEAPLDTIKQANREVMQEFLSQLNGLSPNEREVVLRNFTIVVQFGNNDFKKIVIDSVRLSEKELGKPLFVS